jgi:hypothetical protein
VLRHILCHRIRIVKVQLPQINLNGRNPITHKHIFLCVNLIRTWIVCNMGNKQEREITKLIPQNNSNCILVIMINGPSLTIFATSSMYMDITHLAQLNMLNQIVLIFHKFLFLLLSSNAPISKIQGCKQNKVNNFFTLSKL